jgi:cation transport regulator ChaB
MPPWPVKTRPNMSLNRYEEALFSYWEKNPDERRHWQGKVTDAARVATQAGETARTLERELWEHFVERGPHVPALRELGAVGLRRVSLLNLAEHIIRLWGPPPKPRKPAGPRQ